MSGVALLDPRVASAFYGGFSCLREAQVAAIEPLVNGGNAILSAGTGSGKTEAVVAPLISRYWRQAVKSSGLVLLYIAPTKALVNDLEKRLHLPLQALGLRIGVRHGDRDDLTCGPRPHVLITTPESLDVLMFRKDDALSSLRAAIIDEVHLLYNTQRGLHLSVLLQRLRSRLPNGLQWAALSATIARLSDVRNFLFGRGAEATCLSYAPERSIDAHIRHVTTESQFLDVVRRLLHGRATKLLIFANARRVCERLAGVLSKDAGLGCQVFAHYSSLATEVRLETERQFATSGSAVCVATSTLELGIDIGDIDAILLWGVPGGVESFLQRVGRGNRRSHKTNVVCLVPDDAADVIGNALRFAALTDAAANGEYPAQAPFDLYGVVAQQCLGAIAADGGAFTRIADLCTFFSHQAHLDRPTVESILAELASHSYLQRHGFKNRYGADDKLHQLVDYRMIYGNFPVGSEQVEVYFERKCLGTVPAVNLLQFHGGSAVRFAGKCWRVRKASRDRIALEPLKPTQSARDFAYPGGGIDVDPFLADRVWQLLHQDSFPEELFAKPLRGAVLQFKNELNQLCSAESIPFARSAEGLCYFTCAGRIVNRAIALINGKAGFEAGDLTLRVASPVEWSKLPTALDAYEHILPDLFSGGADQSIYQQLLPKELQLREVAQEWFKDETIARILARLSRSTPVAFSAHRLLSAGMT